MYFIFVLVICILSLPTLSKDKCNSLEDDISDTYKHSEIFINNSIRNKLFENSCIAYFLSWAIYTQKIV